MTAPSLLHAARTAPDAHDRICKMAMLMREHAYGPEGACTVEHLFAAGYSAAETEVYPDDARAMLAGKPSPLRTLRPGRLEGLAMVRAAQAIRAIHRPLWRPPVVGEQARTTWSAPSIDAATTEASHG